MVCTSACARLMVVVLTPPTQELLSVAMQLEWCRSARGNEAPHLPKHTGCVRTHLSYVYSLSPTPFCCLGKTGNVSLSWDPAGHNVTTGSLLMCPEVFLRPKPGLYHTAGRKPMRVWHHMLPAMHCSSGGSPSPGLGPLHLNTSMTWPGSTRFNIPQTALGCRDMATGPFSAKNKGEIQYNPRAAPAECLPLLLPATNTRGQQQPQQLKEGRFPDDILPVHAMTEVSVSAAERGGSREML